MTTEQSLVSSELNKLVRDHALAVQYFADLASKGIADIPMEVVQAVGMAGQLVEAARVKYEHGLKHEYC